jgi:hypothetical protein
LQLFATLSGSLLSSQPSGFPVLTWQNLQALVQVSPKIIKVAVPVAQHSPRLGHLASSQTVKSFFSRKLFLIEKKISPLGIVVLSQGGLRSKSVNSGYCICAAPAWTVIANFALKCSFWCTLGAKKKHRIWAKNAKMKSNPVSLP